MQKFRWRRVQLRLWAVQRRNTQQQPGLCCAYSLARRSSEHKWQCSQRGGYRGTVSWPQTLPGGNVFLEGLAWRWVLHSWRKSQKALHTDADFALKGYLDGNIVIKFLIMMKKVKRKATTTSHLLQFWCFPSVAVCLLYAVKKVRTQMQDTLEAGRVRNKKWALIKNKAVKPNRSKIKSSSTKKKWQQKATKMEGAGRANLRIKTSKPIKDQTK